MSFPQFKHFLAWQMAKILSLCWRYHVLMEHKDFLGLSDVLCNANANGRRHRKPINQQQRKLLSCPVVCLARSIGGGESVVSLCQLAHVLFNYLALRHQMNLADLWICPFPIYQKTIKASLYALSPKHSWVLRPLSRISLLCIHTSAFSQSGLSNGLQQVGGRPSVDSQVQCVVERLIMKDCLNPLRVWRAKPGPKPDWMFGGIQWNVSKLFSCSEQRSLLLQSPFRFRLLVWEDPSLTQIEQTDYLINQERILLGLKQYVSLVIAFQ